MFEPIVGALVELQLRWPELAVLLLATARSCVLVAVAWLGVRLAGRRLAAADERRLWSWVVVGLVVVGVAGVGAMASGSSQQWIQQGGIAAPVRALALVWGAPAGLLLVRLAFARRAAARLLRAARPLSNETWAALAETTARANGGASPRLRVTGEVDSPVILGVVRPCLLIPEALLDAPAPLRHAVLLHEIEHLHSRDVLTRQLGLLARALLWFSPAVWLAVRRARLAGEHASDARALAAELSAADYARHLVEHAEAASLRPVPGVAAALAAHDVVLRLERLRRLTTSQPATPRPRLVAFAALLLVLVAFAMDLPQPQLLFLPAGETDLAAVVAEP